MGENAVATGSSVILSTFLMDYELKWARDHNTSWYRSKERKGSKSPITSFMLNKKWTLEEEFNNHLLRFQQVTANSIFFSYNLQFDIPGRVDSH